MMKITNLCLFRIVLLLSCSALMWTNSAVAQLNFDGALAIWLLDEGRGIDVKDFSGNDNGGGICAGQSQMGGWEVWKGTGV